MKKLTIIILLIISIYGEEYNLDYKATKLAKTVHQYGGYAILGLVASKVF